MTTPRQSLYRRLPEIYRIRDAEQFPVGQLAGLPRCARRDSGAACVTTSRRSTMTFSSRPVPTGSCPTSPTCSAPRICPAIRGRSGPTLRAPFSIAGARARWVRSNLLVFTLSGWAAQAVELRNNLGLDPAPQSSASGCGRRAAAAAADLVGVRGARRHASDPRAGAAQLPQRTVRSVRPRRRRASRERSGRRATTCPISASFVWRLEDYTVPVADPGVAEARAVAGAATGEAPRSCAASFIRRAIRWCCSTPIATG